VGAQADDARYAGNTPHRRKELKQALLRETASPLIQTCFLDRNASHACGRRLAALARAYQVLAEAYLVDKDCAEGASLDVMRSQVKFQSVGPDGGDPRCAAFGARVRGVQGVRRLSARARSTAAWRAYETPRRDGVTMIPDVGR